MPLSLRFALFTCLVAALLAPMSARAELVDFTGIDENGGVFSTSVGGDALVEVTVEPIANLSAAGATLAAEYGGAGLRQITQNAGGTYDVGDQSLTTFQFAQPSLIILSTGSGLSAADNSDILRIEPVGVAPGGPDFWNVSGTSAVTVSEDANHVLTLTGTGPGGTFMTYVAEASAPISSLVVTHESAVSGTSFNSTIYDLDVPLATVAEIPTLNGVGTVLLSLLLLSVGWLLILRGR